MKAWVGKLVFHRPAEVTISKLLEGKLSIQSVPLLFYLGEVLFIILMGDFLFTLSVFSNVLYKSIVFCILRLKVLVA